MLIILKEFLKTTFKRFGIYDVAIDLYNIAFGSYLAKKNDLVVKHVGGCISITQKKLCQSIIISRKHKAYLWDILSDFNRWYSAVVPTSIAKMQVVDFSKPKIHTVLPYCVELYYVSFAESMSMMEKEYFHWYKPKSGDIIFDCGAYCGDTSFIFSKLVGAAGKVYAFEPDPENFAMLLKNIEKHDLKNVIPINKGISSQSSTVFFNSDGNLGASITNSKNSSCQIEVISLSDAYMAFGIAKLDFIKMDIEGAEIEAIKGSIDFLSDHSINLSIANHVVNGKNTYVIIEDILKQNGYEFETTNPSGNNTWSGLITYARKIIN